MKNTTDKIWQALEAATHNIRAYALLRGGQYIGRVIVKHGERARVWVHVTGENCGVGYGSAGGGGYDKISAAYADAVKGIITLPSYTYCGVRWDSSLTDAGYLVQQIV